MAEYINKAELWKKMTQRYDEVADILEVVDDMPTIDIVHCSECKHYDEDAISINVGWCSEFNGGRSADFFCADGERNTPPIVTEEITELNEENNRLFKENEKLKSKLHKISQIAKEETK